jgi:hypothetical protein
MIHVRLPDQEARRLGEEFRSATDRKYRDRLQIILLAHKGRPRQDIATVPGTDRRSVHRWINACCERGLAALVPRKPAVRRHRRPEVVRAQQPPLLPDRQGPAADDDQRPGQEAEPMSACPGSGGRAAGRAGSWTFS